MTLVRWRPINNVVSSFVRDLEPFFKDEFFNDRWLDAPSGRTWYPVVDLEEKDNEVVLNVELPGMTKEDIDLSVENNVLTLKGEKKVDRKEGEKESGFYRSERYFGSFERSFTLPAGVQADKAKATFQDGVLRLALPKKEEAKSRKISIS
jgi:HSP20 family protein